MLSLQPKVIGKKINKVEVFEDKISDKALIKLLRKQPKLNFIETVTGCEFKDIERRAKFLISKIEKMNTTYYIVVHLAMAGKWLYAKKLEDLNQMHRKHILVQFVLDDGSYLVYSDYRRFGSISVHTEDEYWRMKNIHGLGPEPFWEGADEIYLNTLRTKKKYFDKPIKGVIMDQGVVAGVGNIYACEALWVMGINPNEKVQDLSDSELLDIFHTFKETMLFSISLGGSSINDYVNADGLSGGFQEYLKVYDRKQCECGSNIEKEEVAGRTTHYCPKCQPLK
ncbi:gp292 [Bacillus phage G]|uniref:Gp292 n=1 Tax=Bacillus phage G TaxID=2884420 RepID=G3MA33_9CAUD|nr:gp292 [Bacillus phage G]AEO93551.1 gp292 [Bacillus phage G]